MGNVIVYRGIVSPIIIHALIFVIFGETTSPTLFLKFTLCGTFFVGLLLAAAKLPLPAVVAVGLVFPALTAWSDLYWKIGAVSPHSSELLEALPMPGRPAYVFVSALVLVAAWLACLDRRIRASFKSFDWSGASDAGGDRR